MGEVIDLEERRGAKGDGTFGGDGGDCAERFCRCGVFRSSPARFWSKEQTAVDALLHLTAVCNMTHLPQETRELAFRAVEQLAPLLPHEPGERFNVDAIIYERYRDPGQHS